MTMRATLSQNTMDEIPELEDASRGDETPAIKVSTDTEQAGHLGHLSLASPYHPGAPDPRDLKVQGSTSSSGEVRKVCQVTPLPPKFEQPPPEQINIKQLVSEVSRQVTQSVVGQLTGLSPADAQADINICQALAAARRGESTATVTRARQHPSHLQAAKRRTKSSSSKRQLLAACGPYPGPATQELTSGSLEPGPSWPTSRHYRKQKERGRETAHWECETEERLPPTGQCKKGVANAVQ